MDQSKFSSLLKESNQLTDYLEKLKEMIKYDNDISEMYNDGYSLLQEATKFKNTMHNLAKGLSDNRQLTQLKKQTVKKNQVFLEGLQQLKANMKQSIVCTQTDVENIDSYLVQPIGQINWVEGFQSCENKLDQNFQILKERNKQYLLKIQEKQALQKTRQEEKKKSQILPKQIKKLSQQCSEIANSLGIQEYEYLKKIDNHKLSLAYDIFYTLKRNQKIQVIYEKEDYQYLQILIEKQPLKLYELAKIKKINIQEKPLKLIIISLIPSYKQLVIGVDRRSDFSNMEIFNRFINNQEAKNIYVQPENEAERNINNKYIALDSIQTVLSTRLDVQEFLKMIRLRLFSLNLNKFIFENMKKLSFYQPLLKQGETSLNGKKPNITEFIKITFKDYIQKVRVQKNKNTEKIINSYEFLKKGIMFQGKKSVNKINSQKNQQEIEAFLQKQCLDQFILKNNNQYYLIRMNYNNVFFSAIFIIPYNYPKNNSKIKILQLYTKKEKEVIQFHGLRCRYVESQDKVNFPFQMSQIQKQVNDQIDGYVKEDGQSVFRLLFQVNRLCSIIINFNNKVNQKSKII